MRLCYISKLVLPSRRANAIQVMQMCQAFAQLKHDIVLLAARMGTPEPAIDWPVYGINSAASFDVRLLPLGKHPGASITFHLKAAWAAKRMHSHAVICRNLHAAACSTWLGMKTVMEVHALQRNASERFWIRVLRRRRRSLTLVFITAALRDDFCIEYPDAFSAAQMIVLPDGVDLSRFSPQEPREARAQLAIAPDAFIAGYVGSFYRGRGIEEIILPLAKSVPECTFLLVGADYESLHRVTELLHAGNIQNVIVKPFLPNQDVALHLAACDVLLAPYQADIAVSGGRSPEAARWISPLKLFEYMAAGRAILVSDLPVLREVLDETNCFFCQPDALAAWESTLRLVMKDEQERHRRAAQAAADAVNYTWSARAHRCVNALNGAGRPDPK